jgi:hypothetical protein
MAMLVSKAWRLLGRDNTCWKLLNVNLAVVLSLKLPWIMMMAGKTSKSRQNNKNGTSPNQLVRV